LENFLKLPVRHRLRELDDTLRLRVADRLAWSLTEHNIHKDRLWLRCRLIGNGSAITSSVSESSVLSTSEPDENNIKSMYLNIWIFTINSIHIYSF